MAKKDYRDVFKITQEQKQEIIDNSPKALPLNPTAQGYSGSTIRKKMYQAIVGEKGSVLALLEKLVGLTADELNSLAENIDGDFLDLQENKLNKIWDDITEQTTTNLADVLVFNRGDKVYKTTVANLLAHGAVVDLFTTVAELPEVGLPNKIYLVSSNDPKSHNSFDEYIWVNGDWEKIGSVTIDLSNYYNKTEINNLLTPKITKAQGDTYYVPLARTVNGKALSTNITLNANDVGARPSTWTPTYAEIGGTKPPVDADKTPDLKTINGESIIGTGNIEILGDDGGYQPDGETITLNENDELEATNVAIWRFD